MPQYFQAQTISVAGSPIYYSSSQLVSGQTITVALPKALGVQLQISGLNADSLTFTQSMDGVNYANATLMKDTSALVAAQAMTGTANNGNYSVFGFAGYLQFTRTGSADTNLKIGYRAVS